MSGDNLGVARRFNAAISAGEEEALGAVSELCDPEVDYYPARKFPEARPCHGREEVGEFLSRLFDAYARVEWAISETLAIADDRALLSSVMRTEARGSGIRLDGDLYQCMWFRHGQIFRLEDHLTLSGALHALGLEGTSLEAAGLRQQRAH